MSETKNSPGRIGALDGWRGIAILMVLCGHFVPGLGLDGGFNAGRAGVEVFFALSGTLIGRQLLVDRMSLRDFAARRGARILPAMWVFIVVATLIAHNSRLASLLSAVGLANLAPNAEALQHLWSVSLELQGYALLAAVAFAVRRLHWNAVRTLLGILAVAWLMIGWAAWRHADAYYVTYWRAPYRLTAMLLAAALTVHFAHGRRPPGRWSWWALAGVALQATAIPDSIKYTIGSAFLAVGVASLAADPDQRAAAPWLAVRPLVWLGAISYSVYLWQQLILVARPTGMLLDFAIALGLGALAHRLWDRPLHHRAMRAWLPARPTVTATPASESH